MTQMTELKLDRDEAIRKIRASRNRRIFLHVSRLFESRQNPDRGYNLSDCIHVNAKQAEKWLMDAISTDELVEKIWVYIKFDDHCLFVG